MRILFLQKRPVIPPDTGGTIRTLNIVRYLARWHDVTYLCNVKSHEGPSITAMRELGLQMEAIAWKEAPRNSAAFYRQLAMNLLNPWPFNVAKDYDRRLKQRAQQLLNQQPFDLVICDFVQMAGNAIALTGAPKLLFQHNVEAEIFERHAKHDVGWLRRQYMAHQWRKMRRFEARAGKAFDAVIAVSERDRQIFQQHYGWQHVHTIDTAVDVEYFQPTGREEDADRVVFVGSMDWLPNIGGIEFFVRQVWPQIRAARPNAKFQVVGRNPGGSITQLNKVEGVEIVGTVPDVRPYLEHATVVVVPLLVGGGTRIKIFEAMAMGKAVVSTTLGAEGLNVQPGEHIELADTPEDIAAKVLHMLNDSQQRRQLGQRARELVVHKYSAERVAEQFHNICCLTAGKPQSISTAGCELASTRK